jgi:glyoxylase-like metal-dependent hydrolase (beta-lactamase superfamily II)
MAEPGLLSRRLFLADLGRGAAAIVVLGAGGTLLAACGSTEQSPQPSGAIPSGSPSNPGSASPSAALPSASAAPSAGASLEGATPVIPGGVAWSRVDLGFVSAYILVRDGEATIVDTGVAGSGPAIQAAMDQLGLGGSDVSNVILTHRHADHAGSIDAVLALAPSAAGWIGAADLAAVQASRPLSAVSDGDEVFGLSIIGTPGHTAGHISVLDAVGGVLVAGDALSTMDGPLAGSPPQFTEDAAAARASVVKLGKLTFETLLVGHGDPILTGASAQVRALAGG